MCSHEIILHLVIMSFINEIETQDTTDKDMSFLDLHLKIESKDEFETKLCYKNASRLT